VRVLRSGVIVAVRAEIQYTNKIIDSWMKNVGTGVVEMSLAHDLIFPYCRVNKHCDL